MKISSRHRPRGAFLRIWVALLALGVSIPAMGQDLSSRRGFSVEITSPGSDSFVQGEMAIEAEVEMRDMEDFDRIEFFVNDELVFIDREAPFRMIFDFGRTDRQFVIKVIAHHKEGPTVSDFVITRALDPSFFVNVQRVVLDVSVRDKQKRLVVGLGKEDFSVEEEGKPQKLISVSPEQRPILVGILIDSSGSMRERMKEAQEAACSFVEELEDDDRAFVIDFDESVYLIEETTHDRTSLCRAIRSTVAVGGTALHDAVYAAYRVLRENEAERRALVILSDGEDTESRIRFKRVMETAELAEVTVYTIGLSVPALSDARVQLKKLAAETGGRSFFVSRAKDLAETYGTIAEELKSLYQVIYASDNEVFDGRYIEIKVHVKGMKDHRVRHRRGYRAIR